MSSDSAAQPREALDGPLVSIIIPSYNREALLPRAVHSVLSQSYRHIELIVVDDGSRDNTAAWVQSLSDPRVRYLAHSSNYGQNAALNTGVVSAKGELVGFCDSDDELMPSYVQRFVERFQADSELGAVYCQLLAKSPTTGRERIAMPFRIEGHVYKQALAQGYLSHMITLMVKRELLKKTRLFDTNFTNHQDDDFCFRVARHAKVGLIPEPLAVQWEDDAPDRVTANKLDYAHGFRRLLDKFKDDILAVAGLDAWLNHSIKSAYLYVVASDLARAEGLLKQCVQDFNQRAQDARPSTDESLLDTVPDLAGLRAKLAQVMTLFNQALQG